MSDQQIPKAWRSLIGFFDAWQETLGCRSSWLWIVFAGELVLVELYQVPTHLGFDAVAFGDGGLNLTIQYLLRQGYRPSIDFGYPYGGISPIFGAIWFGLFGTTPAVAFAATVACDMVFAVGLATFARRLRLGLPGVAIILVGIPFSVLLFMTFSHALERAILCWGLAEQAKGDRAGALALAGAAVFAKPSMGYVYGLLLMILMLWCSSHDQRKPTAFLRCLIPAFMVALVLFAITIAAYGADSAQALLLPISGATMYRANDFGFLSSGGRTFWYFPGVHVAYYFGTVCAFWLATTLFVVTGGCFAGVEILRRQNNPEGVGSNREIVLTCALLHIIFVSLFFGSNASWTNYVYILVMGAAAMSVWSLNAMRITIVLAILGALGQKGMVVGNYLGWARNAPSEATLGLWAPRKEALEWTKVLTLVRDQETVLLAGDGAASLLFGEFEKPVALTLFRGQASPGEIVRQAEQLSQAQIAVVPGVVSVKWWKWLVIIYRASYTLIDSAPP